MDYEDLLYEMSGHVLTITFNRPERLNAFSNQTELELRHALERADGDPLVRAIILTGAGRAFCVGAHMAALQGVGAEPTRAARVVEPVGEGMESNYQRRLSYMLRISKPMIAAINGPIAGVGVSLAVYCDLRFMLDTANLSTSFARRGLVAEHGMSWMLPRLVGVMNALDLLMTGRKLSGLEAERLGLVRALPADELMPAVRAFAADLADNTSPRSTAIIKRQVYDALMQHLGESLVVTETEEIASFACEDFREGVAHFVERRPPAFTGR
ncbi:MAG: enoyl-CoA hydratase-related protein [Phenylobacterium sp.]|uniref:enoyl-CoA hydratase-related protein n=1 Tax=Phenylobacterium sp. TaxID=1871053 RepID=UPI0027372468|nr:enoyl-CoA hydratase-related protein [Phenylobacterium sp.]MDP3176075.1 enoyl-CoA hydratase-related protein [Phenylobacterium sp.]